jgi:hypothetical protein
MRCFWGAAGIIRLRSKARDDFRMVGTHAIYACESMAGIHLRMELLASGDVDLLYDSRKQLSLVARNLDGNGLLGLLRKVVSSFDILEQESFRAVNRRGLMVDLIIRAVALGCHTRITNAILVARQKLVYDHSVMQKSCKLRKNSVYSRLLGGRNEYFRNDADGPAERGGGPAQAKQWHAA